MKFGFRTAFLSIPVFLGGLELALRLVGYSFADLYRPDRLTGWSLRPDAEGWVRTENPAGVYVRINSDGLRDREHSIAKPASTLRIALLGDSLCEASEVSLEDAFWTVFTRELSHQGQAVEVINFGVSGYGTAQEWITLQTKVWKYEPDVVLLAFTNGDVIDNYRPLSGHPLAPYYVLRDDGALLLDDSFRHLIRWERLRDLKASLAQNSRVIQLAGHIASGWRPSARPAPQREAADQLFAEPVGQDWKEAWRVTEELLARIHSDVKDHRAQLWIATLPDPIQIHPDPGVTHALADRLNVPDLFYPERRIQEWCARRNIPAIALTGPMSEHAAQHQVFLTGFGKNLGQGHWNPNGHQIAGQILARRMCEIGLNIVR
jgi:hypothetical protein